MTAKRFQIDDDGDISEFDSNGKWVDCWQYANGKHWEGLCNELNHLNDENEQLKSENEELKQDSIDKKRVMAYLCKYTNWSFDEIVDDIFNNDYYDNYWGDDSYEWNWDDYVKEKEHEL